MSTNESPGGAPEPHAPQYRPGDVVNGHILDENYVWQLMAPPLPAFQPQPQPKPNSGKKVALLTVAGVVGSLLLIGTIGAASEGATGFSATADPGDRISQGMGSKDASADVKFDKAIDDDGLLGGVKAVLIVTNHSEKVSNYKIELEALDENGVRVDDTFVTVDNLAPGAKAEAITWAFTDERVTTGSAINVTEVSRTSSN